LLRDIERITRMKVPVVENHPFVGVPEDPRSANERDRIPAHHRGGGRGQHPKRQGQGARKAANGANHGGGEQRGGQHRSGEQRGGESRNHSGGRSSRGRGRRR
jgi:ATP-dependent RNA helicase RhlE